MTNTTFEKMVKAEKFAFVAGLVSEHAEVVAFLTHEAEMVAKKNAKKAESRKPSKAQVENEKLVSEITEFMSGKEELFTAQEVMVAIGKEEFTAQKASALMKKAVETGLVVKSDSKKEKKVAYTASQGE